MGQVSLRGALRGPAPCGPVPRASAPTLSGSGGSESAGSGGSSGRAAEPMKRTKIFTTKKGNLPYFFVFLELCRHKKFADSAGLTWERESQMILIELRS